MAEVLEFEPVLRRRKRTEAAAPRDQEFSFWPEVSSGLWVAGTPQVNPANSEKRVLLEMLLVLGTTAGIAIVISLFVGVVPPA